MNTMRAMAAVAAASTALVIASPAQAATAAGTLGPYGYGGVKLGMTTAQAKATGKLVREFGGYCSRYHYKADKKASLFLSKKRGVAVIFAPPGARTPKGIAVGATLSQVKKAYPGVKKEISGYYATVPGNRKAFFYFGVNQRNKVEELALGLKTQDCVN
ncbi:hypothetical protein SAMN05444920_11979 [Nonomuraea solani]|uniref:Uncharacterized protein n=1 Tax=Nonomuraea solani TaxID=1144553 RepID=A0A1H6EWB5_9ACTN|nr:hypothetical protein [Nonomuraea solani]SEH01149.1 hypothetical protein SAMN05444920_11979 [Nonomuraea solani]